ncbi:Hypothetical protein MVR_LOCUS194 [uncultured virus]|nr:Hypothetical protein MVR_LOCUS194 [uncultured virus]
MAGETDLFRDGYLNLNYDMIRRAHNNCGAHRISLAYQQLCCKIELIERLDVLYPTQDCLVEFGYEHIVKERDRLRTCIEICIGLNFVQKLFSSQGLGSVLRLCKQYVDKGRTSFVGADIRTASIQARKLFDLEPIAAEVQGAFRQYLLDIQTFALTTLTAIPTSSTSDILTIFEKVSAIQKRLAWMINNTVTTHDPSNRFAYRGYVDTNGRLHLTHIGGSIWISTQSEIDLNPPCCLRLTDAELAFTTPSSLELRFSPAIRPHDSTHELRIMEDLCGDTSFTIYYDLEPEIPCERVRVKIENMPPHISFYASVLRSASKHSVSKPVPIVKQLHGNRPSVVCTNTQCSIYLFGCMLDCDPEQQYLRPSMLGSFMTLVQNQRASVCLSANTISVPCLCEPDIYESDEEEYNTLQLPTIIADLAIRMYEQVVVPFNRGDKDMTSPTDLYSSLNPTRLAIWLANYN